MIHCFSSQFIYCCQSAYVFFTVFFGQCWCVVQYVFVDDELTNIKDNITEYRKIIGSAH